MTREFAAKDQAEQLKDTPKTSRGIWWEKSLIQKLIADESSRKSVGMTQYSL